MTENKYQKQLTEFLSGFVTENRMEKFNTIINHRTRHITLALEDIYQPHNASAVLRSCECFGIQDIHIIENKNKYHVNPDVALGSSKWLTLKHYNKTEDNTEECIKSLKKGGYRIIATSSHKDDFDIDKIPLDQKIALFFGTEMHGLSDVALSMADAFVKIPMYGFTESFNISVSAAICLFSITSRLRNSDIAWQLTGKEKDEIKLQWLRNSIRDSEAIEAGFKKNRLIK